MIYIPDNLGPGVGQNNSEFSLSDTIISSFSVSISISSLSINNLISERVGPGRGKSYRWGSTGWGPGGGYRYRGRGKSATLGCCCGKTSQGQKTADKGLKNNDMKLLEGLAWAKATGGATQFGDLAEIWYFGLLLWQMPRPRPKKIGKGQKKGEQIL